MPIKLYEDYKVINTNVSELLTISPNNSVSSYDFINQIETVRNEKGNAYVLIERDTFSQPSKLYLLNSDIVNIAIENNSREVYYIIHAASGNKLIIHNMDMLHFKHIVGSNMLKGISPIDVLKIQQTLMLLYVNSIYQKCKSQTHLCLNMVQILM